MLLLSNEMIQRAIERNIPAVYLKLDIIKAFDYIEWKFIYFSDPSAHRFWGAVSLVCHSDYTRSEFSNVD